MSTIEYLIEKAASLKYLNIITLNKGHWDHIKPYLSVYTKTSVYPNNDSVIKTFFYMGIAEGFCYVIERKGQKTVDIIANCNYGVNLDLFNKLKKSNTYSNANSFCNYLKALGDDTNCSLEAFNDILSSYLNHK